MNKLIRFYNQNRHMVWVVILSIVAIIVVIQVLDNLAYEKNNTNQNVNTDGNNSIINNNYSVITMQEVKSNVADIIDEFINSCNNGQVEKAYDMLSDECKEVLYPNLEGFKKNYYNRIFDEKKSYICQAWISLDNVYTYRIDFTADMLATGNPSTTSIVDYYTVVESNDEYKLNINKFIGTQTINAEKTVEDVTINVQRKRMYMDYEIYDIEVVNNTSETIMLDDMKSTKNVYVEDNNEQKYFWYSHEIIENDITVRSGLSQEISIKFNKIYKPYNETVKIVFAKIVPNNKSIDISIEI